MRITIEKVAPDGFDMSFFRFGRGEKTLVILPGLSVQSVMNSADAIAAQYALLAEYFTIYVFDRRETLPKSYSVSDMARDAYDAMRTLGLEDICLFGASQGGMIALTIAEKHPGFVRALALGSSCARLDAERYAVLDRWASLAKEGDAVGLFLDFGKMLYPAKMFEEFRSAFAMMGRAVTDEELARFVTLCEGSKGFDASAELENVTCPTLVIDSKDDAVLGENASREIVDALGNRESFSRFEYDGFGHASFDTAPDYKQRLLDFFKSAV